jgi:hypothetical protein
MFKLIVLLQSECSSEAERGDVSVTLKAGLGVMKNFHRRFVDPTKIFLVNP